MATTKLGQILNKLMLNKGLRVTELARLVHLPQPTIHRIATGTISNPHISSLKPIADFFVISVDQLKGLEPIPDIDQVSHVPLLDHWHETIALAKVNRKEKEQILTDAKVSPTSFALKVKDAAMEPVFPKGTLLIVDPQKSPKDRSYVIVKLATQPEPIFRQLLIDATQQYIKPLSPDLEQYKLIRLNNDDMIIGVIAQAKHTYDE